MLRKPRRNVFSNVWSCLWWRKQMDAEMITKPIFLNCLVGLANECLKKPGDGHISESQHLNKIGINETFPEISIQKQEAETKKQLLAATKATIGFDYGDDGGTSNNSKQEFANDEESDTSSDDEDFFSEIEDIPPLRELNPTALQDLEKCSLDFGMGYNDFIRAMDQDQNMQEQADAVKAIETEKLKMAGKKSRRERRVLKDQRLRNRIIGPLSYVQHQESGKESESESESSASDDDKKEGEIEFITSFGDNNESQGNAVTTGVAPVKRTNKTEQKKKSKRSRSRSKSRRSRSRDRHRRSRSRSRDYGRSRYSDAHYRHRRSSPRNRSRSRSRDRDRWRRDRRRSRSRSRGRRSLSRDRSPSRTTISKKLTAASSKPAISAGPSQKLTPQEMLKIKMQRALKKQLKADKIAMADKRTQMFNEQRERDEELREMARKMRRREDERYDRGSPYRRSSYR